MKNLPIEKQIQKFAGASVYQHLLPGWQEHWGLSFLNLTYKNNKEFNCERRIKSSPEKSPFFSHSNFWTWPSQQKCPALTPYHSWCTITLNTGASSISMDEYSVFHFVQVLVVILLVQVLCLYLYPMKTCFPAIPKYLESYIKHLSRAVWPRRWLK
jgi:hypothetical protein